MYVLASQLSPGRKTMQEEGDAGWFPAGYLQPLQGVDLASLDAVATHPGDSLQSGTPWNNPLFNVRHSKTLAAEFSKVASAEQWFSWPGTIIMNGGLIN